MCVHIYTFPLAFRRARFPFCSKQISSREMNIAIFLRTAHIRVIDQPEGGVVEGERGCHEVSRHRRKLLKDCMERVGIHEGGVPSVQAQTYLNQFAALCPFARPWRSEYKYHLVLCVNEAG